MRPRITDYRVLIEEDDVAVITYVEPPRARAKTPAAAAPARVVCRIQDIQRGAKNPISYEIKTHKGKDGFDYQVHKTKAGMMSLLGLSGGTIFQDPEEALHHAATQVIEDHRKLTEVETRRKEAQAEKEERRRQAEQEQKDRRAEEERQARAAQAELEAAAERMAAADHETDPTQDR